MNGIASVDFEDTDAAHVFTISLKNTGFAVIKNHPISAKMLEKLYQEWAAFFASDEKKKYIFTADKQAGYFPFKSENAKDSKFKDLKEFYHFYPWWDNPDSIMTITPKFREEMVTLASELLSWVELHTPEAIRKKFSCRLAQMIENSPETLFRAIHYPALDGNEQPGEVRAAAHEDINLITLLPAATNPGLQVQDNQGKWHDVSCDPGNIVVNTGDMLAEASDGYYTSTSHRVVNPAGVQANAPRYSMPLFLHARPEVQLSKRHTAKSYLRGRLNELGLLDDQ